MLESASVNTWTLIVAYLPGFTSHVIWNFGLTSHVLWMSSILITTMKLLTLVSTRLLAEDTGGLRQVIVK